MTNHYANSADNALPEAFINKKEISDDHWTIWHIGAGVGLLGGMFTLFCAVFLTIVQYLYGENLHDTWLYAIVLPLWILGAHCFDKIEEIDKALGIEYCEKRGIIDEEYEKRKFTERN